MASNSKRNFNISAEFVQYRVDLDGTGRYKIILRATLPGANGSILKLNKKGSTTIEQEPMQSQSQSTLDQSALCPTKELVVNPDKVNCDSEYEILNEVLGFNNDFTQVYIATNDQSIQTIYSGVSWEMWRCSNEIAELQTYLRSRFYDVPPPPDTFLVNPKDPRSVNANLEAHQNYFATVLSIDRQCNLESLNLFLEINERLAQFRHIQNKSSHQPSNPTEVVAQFEEIINNFEEKSFDLSYQPYIAPVSTILARSKYYAVNFSQDHPIFDETNASKVLKTILDNSILFRSLLSSKGQPTFAIQSNEYDDIKVIVKPKPPTEGLNIN